MLKMWGLMEKTIINFGILLILLIGFWILKRKLKIKLGRKKKDDKKIQDKINIPT